MKKAHLIVDMLNDFISGSLACSNTENAVRNTLAHIHAHPDEPVIYICDTHPANHCSFKDFGGIWPAHCVKGTFGGEIHEKFYTIAQAGNRPSGSNIFRKGEDPMHEEYSGYNGVSSCGEKLGDYLRRNGFTHVEVSGIATEYCVKETVEGLLGGGFRVTLLSQDLGYVDAEGHGRTLEELRRKIEVQ